jgi:hypothetical protein
VSVLLGNGDGSFKPKTDIATGGGAYFAAIGDLDSDGKLDLVVANQYPVTLSVLLGNGNGTFAPKTDYSTTSGALSVAIGDLDRDGNPDLVAVNRYSSSVSVLLGNGNGTFRPKTDFGTAGNPYSVAIADLDGDGRLDLAVADNAANTVSVLAGNGDGTFAAKMDFGTGPTPWLVTVADLNRDGKPDLVTANGATSTLSVLLNAKTGNPWLAIDPVSKPRTTLHLASAPNPSRSATTIAFELPLASPVTLEVLDVAGRITRTLAAGTTLAAGHHSLLWDGTNGAGASVTAGIYLVRLRAGDRTSTLRLALLR